MRAPSGSLHLLGYFREEAPAPPARPPGRSCAARARPAPSGSWRGSPRPAPRWTWTTSRPAPGGPIGRPHIADAVVAAGHARDRQDAFERFLHDGGPAASPTRASVPRRRCGWSLDSGGAAGAGPPGLAAHGRPRLSSFVRPAGAGRAWAGSRSHRADHTPERRAASRPWRAATAWLPTGGSDFHRPGRAAPPGRHRGARPLAATDVVGRGLPAGRLRAFARRHPLSREAG